MDEVKFPKMIDKVPEGRFGNVSIDHFLISEKDASWANLRAVVKGQPGLIVSPGKYARLTVDGMTTMSDTRMERESNREFVVSAHGRVLIAGLGLGMILWPLMKKSLVGKVTVVELNPNVIKLVEPWVPKDPRIKVIRGNIFTWKPKKSRRYNTIYFDIWSNVCSSYDKDIDTLKEKYSAHLSPKGWMSDWITECYQSRQILER
jgi:spermidine synthase